MSAARLSKAVPARAPRSSFPCSSPPANRKPSRCGSPGSQARPICASARISPARLETKACPSISGPGTRNGSRTSTASLFIGVITTTELRNNSKQFSDCLYDTTLPSEVVEAVAANLTIIKSPTVLRQTDGRLWSWEGCGDDSGCCHGSCTHVWNYAQAIPHLFPSLERTLRETEFGPSQSDAGHQTFRSNLPIRPVEHDFHAAADGQLGGIMKVFREWRISGDTEWLRGLWPKVKRSLDYCIETWDPAHK